MCTSFIQVRSVHGQGKIWTKLISILNHSPFFFFKFGKFIFKYTTNIISKELTFDITSSMYTRSEYVFEHYQNY